MASFAHRSLYLNFRSPVTPRHFQDLCLSTAEILQHLMLCKRKPRPLLCEMEHKHPVQRGSLHPCKTRHKVSVILAPALCQDIRALVRALQRSMQVGSPLHVYRGSCPRVRLKQELNLSLQGLNHMSLDISLLPYLSKHHFYYLCS